MAVCDTRRGVQRWSTALCLACTLGCESDPPARVSPEPDAGAALDASMMDAAPMMDADTTPPTQGECTERWFDVRLAADAVDTYRVVGVLCDRSSDAAQPVLLTVSGAGYGPVYWDFPYQPETYSFVRAAAAAGFATFNLSRIGIAASDHPDSSLLDVDAQAHALHDVVQQLRSELGEATVVAVGHSLGSVTSLATQLMFPGDFDGLLLTGFIHNRSPAFGAALAGASYSALEDPRFADAGFDDGYQTTRDGGRVVFYVEDNTDPEVIRVDDETKETLTLGEALTLRDYYDDQSLAVDVPVALFEGDQDLLGCDENVVCTDPGAVEMHEQAFWSASACLEVDVVPNTGHNINLHRNAPETYARMLDWVVRRFGVGSGAPASAPCAN